ncbi:mitochondrial-processing peptidase subunit alpha-like isoform X2 [Papaver somniferum]|uniref:mitochondrial-processing peptidase subunit alpha-like isoform X2 n=1 Tax=Papaver somniferum TaxID=3469 RepID=UPI000E6FD607|nr:mitochondrial-processing peptidase subunit alpha-like isoform X2 [Papaver somniferum]
MYRASSSRIRGALKGYGQNMFATSASVASAPSSGSFFYWLTGENSKTLPPLNFPLPGVIYPSPLPDYVKPSVTKMTTLPNGVRIASQDSSLEKVKQDIQELKNNPQGLLLEALHSTGYTGALANPLLAPEDAVDGLNGDLLEKFVAENYTAPRIVLSAYGLDHEELLSIAEPLLSDLPAVPHTMKPKSVYIGGEFRCHAETPTTDIAFAFEVPGGWQAEKECMQLTVLQFLMGGGGSFSQGGPGKGMYSRLYRHVLNKHTETQSFTAFNAIYDRSGLFGIHTTIDSEYVFLAVNLLVREFQDVATPGNVKEYELNRAKEAAKSAVLMNMESRTVASEDIGRQILTYGERKPVEDFLKAIDAVTLDDIASIAQRIISSPLTMAAHGQVSKLESYDTIAARFN